MAIPTTRTCEPASITIDTVKCTGCGLCVEVCKDFSLIIKENKAVLSPTPLFGCIGCGHCMAICPTEAITINGRTLSPNDLIALPQNIVNNHQQLLALMQHRRSIREFATQPVASEDIDKILEAAQTAPMGLPPSDVHVLVLHGKEKTAAFAQSFSEYLKSLRFMTSEPFLRLMRPFWGKANDQLFRGFVKPMFKAYTNEMDKGINLINYDAPLAIYFYGSPYSDPADPIVAATYAMLAGEALGLGTCMLGAVHPLIQNGRRAANFRKNHGIKYKSREGLFVIFGHPKVKYRKGIKRTFASIDMG